MYFHIRVSKKPVRMTDAYDAFSWLAACMRLSRCEVSEDGLHSGV